jgi:polysaccharide deacetylase family protein (PEP-CTERM system associated)
MASVAASALKVASVWDGVDAIAKGPTRLILSFDVEEHHRIEAATGLQIAASLPEHYRTRLEPSTRWLLDQLAEHGIKATFFVVAKIAEHNPELIRAMYKAGHEVASHGWDHQRIHNFTAKSFRADVYRSKDALEQVTGAPVVGFRAPTFSLVRQTAWALDVLAESGMLYDSSIFPVRHDRYGIPQAPRSPFLARGLTHTLLEIPPATLRVVATNLPIGGGGYFRLLPLFLLEHALRQVQGNCHPSVAMLYFHPWEFDPRQTRLPLKGLNRFRTYVGIYRSRARLAALLSRQRSYSFARAVDVARRLVPQALPIFDLTCSGPLNGTHH